MFSVNKTDYNAGYETDMGKKAKQVKRCFNENMRRKPFFLEHFTLLFVMITDHF